MAQALGLDDPSAVRSRRIEIGSGDRPQMGYIHVDIDARAPHLEAVAPAWHLPFPDDCAEEILASHSLEHIHPRYLLPTLREWRRVLAPGGRVRVLVPNAVEFMERFQRSTIGEKWSVIGALLGMSCPPDVSRPDELIWPSQHQVLFDRDLLRWAFEEAGYSDIVDLTDSVEDHHTRAWASVVPRCSLVFEASKQPTALAEDELGSTRAA